MQTRTKIFFFTALPCEAKPLIEHYNLKKEMSFREFALFRNKDYCLTVTGPGKTAMAAGIAYTMALMGKAQNPVMINIGVAGHKKYPLGEIFMAEKITDGDNGRVYYPQLIVEIPCLTESICTVSKPENQYEQEFLYDMEASAFYETATRFSTSELIQAMKVISDNRCSSTKNIQAKQISDWIENSLTTLEKLIIEMQALQQLIETVEPEFYRYAIKRWHFTASEKIKLRNVLQRWGVLMAGNQPEMEDLAIQKGKDVIRWLEMKMLDVDFTLA